MAEELREGCFTSTKTGNGDWESGRSKRSWVIRLVTRGWKKGDVQSQKVQRQKGEQRLDREKETNN